MIVYVTMVLTALLISLKCYQRSVPDGGLSPKQSLFKIRKRTINVVALAIPFTLIAGLRYNVGTDYITYLYRFHYIGSVFAGQPRKMEPLYRAVVEFGHFFNSTQLVFFLTALIFSIFIVTFAYDNSKSLKTSLCLIFLTGTFSQSENIMRQMVGVAICLYATKYIFSSEMKKYFIWVLMGTMFHTMCIVYFPLFFVYKINWLFEKKRMIVTIGSTFLLSKMLYGLIIKILVITDSGYVNYYGSSRDTGSSTMLTLVSFFILIFGFVFISPKREQYREKMMYLLLQSLACLILILQLPNANRMAYMFIPVQIVLIPNLFATMKKSGLWYVSAAGFALLYVVFYNYYFYHLNIGETYPYMSIFSK